MRKEFGSRVRAVLVVHYGIYAISCTDVYATVLDSSFTGCQLNIFCFYSVTYRVTVIWLTVPLLPDFCRWREAAFVITCLFPYAQLLVPFPAL